MIDLTHKPNIVQGRIYRRITV